MGNLMWANTYIPEDVMQNSIGTVIGKEKAFNTRLCISTAVDWHAIGMKLSVFNCNRAPGKDFTSLFAAQ